MFGRKIKALLLVTSVLVVLWVLTYTMRKDGEYRIHNVNDIAASLGIGCTSAYKLANPELFKTIRIGNMIRISQKSFEDWLKAEGLDDETE